MGEEVNEYKWNIFQDKVLSVCALPTPPLAQRWRAQQIQQRTGKGNLGVMFGEAQSPWALPNVVLALNEYVLFSE